MMSSTSFTNSLTKQLIQNQRGKNSIVNVKIKTKSLSKQVGNFEIRAM